jgi:phenylacetate-CoA ligase
MVIALGGMDSLQRLVTMRDYGPTTLLCTPTYAVHLAYPCDSYGGMHLREDEFVAGILDPETGDPVDDGATGELVVTALARTGFPVVRYRTGDVVERHPEPCGAGHPGRWLPQGILGRSDDMVVIRGMNVFPSAIEQILREFDGVGEFRITFYTEPSAMDEVKLEVELSRPLEARAIQAQLRQTLGLRVRIVPLKPGILPTPIGKARRVADLRPAAGATLPGQEADEQ